MVVRSAVNVIGPDSSHSTLKYHVADISHDTLPSHSKMHSTTTINQLALI